MHVSDCVKIWIHGDCHELKQQSGSSSQTQLETAGTLQEGVERGSKQLPQVAKQEHNQMRRPPGGERRRFSTKEIDAFTTTKRNENEDGRLFNK
jgi:hypothetical protein